jgi:hypothetical protein
MVKAVSPKMIEAIIRRYKLYRKGETSEELHGDTVSFLMTKVHKFKPTLNKKSILILEQYVKIIY